MRHNLDVIEKFEKIIFSYADCYRTFKLISPKFEEYNFEVLHITEFLLKYVKEIQKKKEKIK